jgi:UDP-N-acetylmuramyl pentapeptide phosphotransferase/UDP-N-acetylglucosamine-1-phosphate transferase
MGQVIPRVGVPGVDLLVAWAPVGVLVTVLMVCGFTNAMNIIDGLNGLSAGLGVLMCAATGWLAHSVGDPALVALCGVLGAALLGFWLVNFPRGWLFMGDGAAYFVGFMLSQIWILLVIRHESISPWIVLAIGFQPTMETVFSILRRRFIHRAKGQAMQADRLHLHCLVFRRRTMHWGLLSGKPRWMANAAAAVWVLGFGALPMLLAVLGPSTTAWGALVLAAGVTGYLVWFRRLVLFKGVGPFGARTRPARAQAAALTVTSVLDR